MVKRQPKTLLLSSTLTIPLLLGGCTQHYEVKEPMSQPCRTAAVHSNTIFRPVRGSQFPSFILNDAQIENGQMKANIGGGWPEYVGLPSYGGDLVEGSLSQYQAPGPSNSSASLFHAGATRQKRSLSVSPPTPICSTTPKNTYHQAKHSHPKTRTRKTPYCESKLCLNHEFVRALTSKPHMNFRPRR